MNQTTEAKSKETSQKNALRKDKGNQVRVGRAREIKEVEPIKAAAWKVEVRLPDGQRDWEEIGSVSPPR